MTSQSIMRRDLAPLVEGAWKQVDDEARRVFETHLTARRLVDFKGPHGWTYAARNTGHLNLFKRSPVEGVTAGLRSVQALVELRVPFVVPQMELDSVGRGAELHLEPVADAAKRIALVEDNAIFNGWKEAGIEGIIPASGHKAVGLPKKGGEISQAVVEAVGRLFETGVKGPYALVLGPRPFQELGRASGEGGYPLRKFLEQQVLEGPVLAAPAVDGGVLLSTRGGDFELTVGQDLSVGYAHHDRDNVEFYIAESFTFRVIEAEAAVALTA